MAIRTLESSTTLERPERPPLSPGDRLTRAEFERRYEAHPEIKKAELLEGVVYMPSPIRYRVHGEPHGHVVGWLMLYCARTPGVSLGDNASVRLDYENEVQPDALLRLDERLGGSSRVTEDDYLAGPPELVVEITASSVSYDMHIKRRVYARSGVQEYIAMQMYERRLDWFVLREGVYETLKPDEEGVIRSEAFPGLWLKPDALLAGDLSAVLDVLQAGLDS
ncbi:MAG: Uma2 family endonuclease, partial [Chloroflexi bacterium]|nr:Uma2 family endonuclease [Chloroflexota bacterium]